MVGRAASTETLKNKDPARDTAKIASPATAVELAMTRRRMGSGPTNVLTRHALRRGSSRGTGRAAAVRIGNLREPVLFPSALPARWAQTVPLHSWPLAGACGS